jgi:hypothetical protein
MPAPQNFGGEVSKHQSKHRNANRCKTGHQRTIPLVEKSRLAQMAPLHPLPHPHRPLVADINLDSFIRNFGMAINKECRQPYKDAARAKINFRAATFSSQQFSPTPCFYSSSPLQSFFYRIAGVAHR